ncbi:hypothetical protein [Undibacterium luofuense]|uniref:Uncharacterized protein n=1 Tax=Undibacterium luofuense TaxID=2828733 RepID=A0A941DPP0_9BURK|nr:hypothetical protein [Undibacterium luofuense]MBR7783650.1 hypothetical protein [Undibacterium luofuense]
MKRTKPLTAVLSLLLLLMANQAAALDDRQSVTDEKAAVSEVPANPLPEESEMPCDPDGMCSDPCKYFGKTAVFAWKGSGALLQYKGKIQFLTEVRKVAVRSIQHLTDVPGGSERLDFVSGKLRISLTTTTISTTCYDKDRRGRWRSLDTCCFAEQRLTLVIHDGKQTTRLKTTADYGC